MVDALWGCEHVIQRFSSFQSPSISPSTYIHPRPLIPNFPVFPHQLPLYILALGHFFSLHQVDDPVHYSKL